jgi:hypothetical protein
MSSETIQFLVQAAIRAPSADNSQPWHFHWDGSDLKVSYDFPRVANVTFDAENPATILAMGGALENILQAAAAIGLEATLELPADLADADGPCYFTVKIGHNTEARTGPAKVLPKLPLQNRYTNRFAYTAHPLPKDLLDRVTGLAEGGARAIALDNASDIRNVGRLVRSASEVRFQTREVHEWLAKSLRFSADDSRDGLDVSTLDLPPGGAALLRFIRSWKTMAFLNRFAAHKLLASIDARPVYGASTIIGFVGLTGYQDTLNAGRLIERIWIELNSNNLAVHPYYVVADQLYRYREGKVPGKLTNQVKAIRDQSEHLFKMGTGETLHMLFRVGFPKHSPTRSHRLPLKTVFTDASSPENAEIEESIARQP